MRRWWATLLVACALVAGAGGARAYDILFLGGVVHGPGALADTPLPTGKIGAVPLDGQLRGATKYFNNGAEPPNIPAELEMEIYGRQGARLSDGTPFHENAYGGIVSFGQGALKMLNVIAGGGPMQGRESFELDGKMNWLIRADMAFDAGFPQGLVITPEIRIYTGVARVPPSLQTAAGARGGVDRAGSLPTGAPVYGMLGDLDEKGVLAGRIVGMSQVPLDFMFMPGGPLVVEREFSTDVPVTREEAGLLTYAGLANLLEILAAADDPAPAVRAYVLGRAPAYLDDFARRARSAQSHLGTVGPRQEARAGQAARIAATLKEQSELARAWAVAGAIPPASRKAIGDALEPVAAELPALRQSVHFCLLGN